MCSALLHGKAILLRQLYGWNLALKALGCFLFSRRALAAYCNDQKAEELLERVLLGGPACLPPQRSVKREFSSFSDGSPAALPGGLDPERRAVFPEPELVASLQHAQGRGPSVRRGCSDPNSYPGPSPNSQVRAMDKSQNQGVAECKPGLQGRRSGRREVPRPVPQAALRNLWLFVIRLQGCDAGALAAF